MQYVGFKAIPRGPQAANAYIKREKAHRCDERTSLKQHSLYRCLQSNLKRWEIEGKSLTKSTMYMCLLAI
jgi:hypothetical protein